MTDINKEDIISIHAIDDLIRLFKNKGYSESKKENDAEAVVQISKEKEFIKMIQIESLSEIQKYYKFLNLNIKYILLFTGDFENFIFAKKEFTKLDTEKFSTFKFNKSNISQTSMKKLNGLEFDNLSTLENLFTIKEIVKKFYELFKKEHERFSKEIIGIPEKNAKEWYATIIINRLMFIYFLQKKKLLYNKFKDCYDDGYLVSMLEYMQSKAGKDLFYNTFLNYLFFEGFAKQYEDRSNEAKHLLGKRIQYLNGGLFSKHKIEINYSNIQINDNAFENLFNFFDEWSWYLDDRHFDDEQQVSADDEINPDVLGFIFEKYVNKKQMGAYYTKDDITGYISKNSIIPFIFDKVKKEHPELFDNNQSSWNALRDNPDTYFYDAMKKGLMDASGKRQSLPEEIAIGINDVSKRLDWNKPAHKDFALETETWREVVARREKYEEIRKTMERGEVNSINDMITYNLNISKFARYFIENINDAKILQSFYNAIINITILDLTCGSGAFLFAALNILESLYESCLERMQFFITSNPKNCGDYVKIQEDLQKYTNRRYFILKNIILNNIFGVDIMEEAVEICKLRLFLKLVANMDNADDIKPLPDIDYNIRCGNTLVGYANKKEVDRAVHTNKIGEGKTDQLKLRKVMTRLTQSQTVFITEDIIDIMGDIEKECVAVDKTFKEFKKLQTNPDINPNKQASAKKKLDVKLAGLRNILNACLFAEYGLDGLKNDEVLLQEDWRKTHLPFHWYTEFHEIIQSGGFDVIIGNPPYVEYSKIKQDYSIKGYETIDCGNLYAFVVERSLTLLHKNGRTGMIVPLAAFGTPTTAPLQKILRENSHSIYISYFSGDAHPSILFEGVKLRLSIFLTCPKIDHQLNGNLYTSAYLRWYADERDYLFSKIIYVKIQNDLIQNTFPKIGNNIELNIIKKLKSNRDCMGKVISKIPTQHRLYYHNAPVFFIRAMNFVPYYESVSSSSPSSNHFKTLYTTKAEGATTLLALMNSTIFYIWFTNYSANRDVTLNDIENFQGAFDANSIEEQTLKFLVNKLMVDIDHNSLIREYNYKTGKVRYQEFYMRKSKLIIDEIDGEIAKHYGFTDEERDYITNYDIKYRMGSDGEE